jgi:uncharacterized protein YjbJ (UPF0337 family)
VGIAEEAKGKLKQAAGKITGREDLEAEGDAQAEKGAEERKATQARAAAQVHEKKAEAYESKQKAAEG